VLAAYLLCTCHWVSEQRAENDLSAFVDGLSSGELGPGSSPAVILGKKLNVWFAELRERHFGGIAHGLACRSGISDVRQWQDQRNFDAAGTRLWSQRHGGVGRRTVGEEIARIESTAAAREPSSRNDCARNCGRSPRPNGAGPASYHSRNSPIVRIEILKEDPKRSRQGFERKARKVGFARNASRAAATTISTSSGAIFKLIRIELSSVARFCPS
jgi:hypothetical protein